jgi:hypothetical protein
VISARPFTAMRTTGWRGSIILIGLAGIGDPLVEIVASERPSGGRVPVFALLGLPAVVDCSEGP